MKKKTEISELINLVARIGQIILQNGGETYRVEQTIEMVCSAYNYPNTESFVIPTGIMISITDSNNETISLIKRIHSRSINLSKVSLINDLSRRIHSEKLSISQVKKLVEKVDKFPNYSNITTSFCTALSSGFFSLLFGGNIKDFFVTFFIGFLLSYLSIYLGKLEVNGFFINISGGFIAVIMSLISIKLGIGSNEDKIVIGSIMLMLPGIAITNAVRDIIAGDLLSGISRTIEAFLAAIAIAVGTGVGFSAWFSLFGGV